MHLEEGYFDDVDFPISYKNESLGRNWYEFNDTAVNAIPVNRLQKQFGGNSGNAYILIYRKKEFSNKIKSKNDMQKIPEYLQTYINNQNEIVEKERIAYKEAEKQIEVIFLNEQQVNVKKKDLNFIFFFENFILSLYFPGDKITTIDWRKKIL